MNRNAVNLKPHMKSRTAKRILILFTVLICSSLTILFSFLSSVQHRRNEISVVNELVTQEMAYLSINALAIQNSIQRMVEDLLFLADVSKPLLFDEDNPMGIDRVAGLYASKVGHYGDYDQIRYIDESGMEIIRVNRTEEGSLIVGSSVLQPKGDRYYVLKTSQLNEGEIYFSPLDLNIENGLVELPHKPMLRLATPLFDSQGNRRGMIVINYLASTVLNLIREASLQYPSEFYLVNSEGYFLINDTDPSLEFAFMFENHSGVSTLQSVMPDLSREIGGKSFGSFSDEKGGVLYTFETIQPFIKLGQKYKIVIDWPAVDGRYIWTAITSYPYSYIDTLVSRRAFLNTMEKGIIWILLALISLLIAYGTTYRYLHRKYLHALAKTDHLTGALSRTWALHMLENLLSDPKNRETLISFLFIDLNRFKQVNDTYGHDAGDAVLKESASRIREAIRKDDLLIRLGGDEFLAVLVDVEGRTEEAEIIQRIQGRMTSPILWGGYRIIMSFSIGEALFPQDGRTVNDLVNFSDAAMYEVKREEHRRYAESTSPDRKEPDPGTETGSSDNSV